jgi:uncharacterized membrane protein YqiK
MAEANRDTTKLNSEAEANRRRTLAEAEAEAIRVQATGEAEAAKAKADGDAFAQRAVAGAEAEAINVRADALQGENQALIAANKLVDLLPSLVEASARGIAGSNLTVLNGTDGVNQVATGVVAQGLSIYESLRQSVARGHGLSTDGAGLQDALGEAALDATGNQHGTQAASGHGSAERRHR